MGKHVSNQMFAGRVSAKGKITSLAVAFSLENNKPFAIFVVPTDATVLEDKHAIIDCTLYKEESTGDCPVTCWMWDVPAITEIAISGIDLTLYDVYWGCGSDGNS